MSLTAWVNQFIDFSETNSYLLDLTTAVILCLVVASVLSFTCSVIARVFTR